jgi:hypothetical protein
MQHDPYSWSVKGAEFIYLEEVTPSGKFLDQTVRNWMSALSTEQREQFVDAVYELLAHKDVHTLQDTAKYWLANTGELIHNLRNVDDETGEMMQRTLKLLGQNILRTAAMQVRPKERLKLPTVPHVFTKQHKEP